MRSGSKKMNKKAARSIYVLFSAALFVLLSLSVTEVITNVAYGQEKRVAQFIICPQCGEKNPLDAKFCWNDGYRLPRPKPVVKKSPAVSPKIPVPEQTELGAVASRPMTEQQLDQLLEQLVRSLEKGQAVISADPSLVGNMTRAELERLLRQTLKDQGIIRQVYIEEEESGFGKFLKFVGGTTLAIFGLIIIFAA